VSDDTAKDEAEAREFEDFLAYLSQSRGFDFTAYKRASLARRVRKRMQSVGIEHYSEYTDYLEVHPEEFVELFNTILINVTSFFRDAPAWEVVRKQVIPSILEHKRPDEAIRVWSAGCASGEEPYTLAICLAEALGESGFRQRVKIYGTDVDEDALATARQATYGARALEPVPPDLREKYFEPINGGFGFRKDLRRAIIFGRHDLLQDAPISRVDLLVCRNTLMYFNSEAQGRVLSRFLFALGENGYLLLGKAETLLTHTAMLTPVDLKQRIFTRTPRALTGERPLPAVAPSMRTPADGSSAAIRGVAFEMDPTPQLSVDSAGYVVAANDRCRQLFGVRVDDLGRPLQDLEVSYRPVELRGLIEESYRDRRAVTAQNVEWAPLGGSSRWFTVQVIPLWDPLGAVVGANVIFADVTAGKQLQAELQQSKHELETAYEELQSSNEELETTNEELQSTVEELETTNEELQSTNEELETMNEELQSSNEEMETVNAEIRDRGAELDRANAFLETVLTSLQVGVVVVDQEIVIRTWNRSAENIWGLRSDEVVGTNFLNLDSGLPTEKLRNMVRACLSGAEARQQETIPAINRRGREIECRVTCLPLAPREREATGVRGAILLMEELPGADGVT
jgi:two-component system CheB/CheR fusion protein